MLSTPWLAAFENCKHYLMVKVKCQRSLGITSNIFPHQVNPPSVI
ncbi:hypothetical protein [Piscirickettsia salmonis]|nr:hypothetical protein [Piscirickettsia salmonis]